MWLDLFSTSHTALPVLFQLIYMIGNIYKYINSADDLQMNINFPFGDRVRIKNNCAL